MKLITQTHPTESKLTCANAAFKNKDFELAIVLYEDALKHSKEPIRSNILFNLNLLKKRLGPSPAATKAKPEKRDITNNLVPIKHLEPDFDDSEYWKSVGDDPHFHIKPKQERYFEAGWYQIELLVESSRRTNLAKFYLNYGDGYSEKNTFSLPYNSKKLAKRIVYFKEYCSEIRFDPKESQGRFRVIGLHITPVAVADAEDIMLQEMLSQRTKVKLKDSASYKIQMKFEKRAYSNKFILVEHIFYNYQELFTGRSDSIAYEDWIECIEKPSLPTAEQVNLNIINLSIKPVISVVMPVFNTDEQYLSLCIDSVIAQTYPHWELCIADDASPKPHVRRLLEAYAAKDARIRVVFRKENGHISHASNSALEIAHGEFVALLDHDDALPDYALYFIALAINANPDAQFFYSDEDKLDQNGARFEPNFKSDWNPDLFYSQNYVSHLGVYRRELLNRINGFRPGVEGSQDQDLLLRCLPHVRHDQIIHVPRVLYHWRMVEGSTALASGEKSYTMNAGVKALQDYFLTVNPRISVEPGQVPNTYRVRWPLPESPPLVSLLIPTRDRRALTETCVRSIIDRSTYTNYEILILDNGSVESETLEFFEQIQKEDRRVRVLRYDCPFNYSAINNFGVLHARGVVIGLVNNDIEVISPEWLTEMLSHAIRPDIGCVGAKLYYSNDTLQHGGVVCGIGGVAGHSHKYFARSNTGYFSRLFLTQTMSAVTAACLLVRRDVYEKVGGLDETNLKIAFNDVDFCLKVREAGYRNLWTPYAELYHYESISRGIEDTLAKQERFGGEVEFMQKKWGDLLKIDPYYSPNLTKDREDFSITSSDHV
ncbi:glycosyltransferase [Polaromonas eurypsychrophila]|uniref:Glycosyltransferase 2-like domain-containing protein n=1 Tax=Polaromonas eurypsychrophila TaxID=1614635 RepID=A0A916SSW6_9BURK|nr:glycosyltransferase [Polaromonas eurypsychrophila]GGB14184.1 hypothetical protein GCM10011496_38930 [Polaromonas eurypsychrophila]